MKKLSKLFFSRGTFFLFLLIASTLSTTAFAVDMNYYVGNGIYFYAPVATNECVVSAGTPSSNGGVMKGNGANGNKDYKDRQIISDERLEKIKKFQPVYEKASKETKIPWQVFAVVHIRESNLADYNPPNAGGSQGIYQDYGWNFNNGKPYPENGTNPVSEEEFLRQTVNAGKELQEKAGSKIDLVEKGDPEAIKDMFFGYNGRATAYADQAKALGFDQPYEGSPYVMNYADEKRDPEVAKDRTWGQIVVDNGPMEYPARKGDYGAYVMYAALAGVPAASSGECTGSELNSRAGANGWDIKGPNAMQIYYQDDPEWADKPYGGTIKSCGCGPTSMAMAIATLNNDSKITPETMSNSFVKNGYLNAGCGTQFWAPGDSSPFSKIAAEYNVTITDLGTDLSKAEVALKRGSFVYMSFVAGSNFGNSTGHIMLMRGVTGDGKYLFADPSTYADSGPTLTSEYLSKKTENEKGFPASDFTGGITVMYEVRKG